jgi:hypothetical protein
MFLRNKDWAQVVKINYFPPITIYPGWPRERREKRVSPQAKAISQVVKDFEQSLENLRPSTRRVYVAGARAAIRAASLELWQSTSATDLLASNWLEVRLPSLTKHRGERNGLTSNPRIIPGERSLATRRIDMIRKGQASQCAPGSGARQPPGGSW